MGSQDRRIFRLSSCSPSRCPASEVNTQRSGRSGHVNGDWRRERIHAEQRRNGAPCPRVEPFPPLTRSAPSPGNERTTSMPIRPRQLWQAPIAIAIVLFAATSHAQVVNMPLTEQDRTEILALSKAYTPALL